MSFIFNFLIVSAACGLFFGFWTGVVARNWALHGDPVVLRGINVERATELVAFYVQGLHDHRFGFPSGAFEILEATRPGQVVAAEYKPVGTMFGNRSKRWSDRIARAGAFFGPLAFVMTLAMWLTLWYYRTVFSLMEKLYRSAFRSRVSAAITPVAGRDDEVEVTFELRGVSAYSLAPTLREGFAEPTLPVRLGGTAPTPVPWTQDRFKLVLYGSAGLAVLLALIVAASAGG